MNLLFKIGMTICLGGIGVGVTGFALAVMLGTKWFGVALGGVAIGAIGLFVVAAAMVSYMWQDKP